MVILLAFSCWLSRHILAGSLVVRGRFRTWSGIRPFGFFCSFGIFICGRESCVGVQPCFSSSLRLIRTSGTLRSNSLFRVICREAVSCLTQVSSKGWNWAGSMRFLFFTLAVGWGLQCGRSVCVWTPTSSWLLSWLSGWTWCFWLLPSCSCQLAWSEAYSSPLTLTETWALLKDSQGWPKSRSYSSHVPSSAPGIHWSFRPSSPCF